MKDCEVFVAAEHAGLLRAAYLLTGDQTSAQDLTQETLIRLLMQWRRVANADSPRAYARKVLLNVFLSGQRRAWRGEVPHAELPDQPALAPYGSVDDQEVMRAALLALPPRQRAAVVLRHYEDRSEAEAARALGCSTGTIKSLTSRGLTTLRELLGDLDHDLPEGRPR